MTPLILGLLNPVGIARLSTPSKERIDLLIDYLNLAQLAQNRRRQL